MYDFIKYADGNYYELVEEVENKQRKIKQYYYKCTIGDRGVCLLLDEKDAEKYFKNI